MDSRDMDQNPKLDSDHFLIESNKATNKAGQMTGDTNPNCFIERL